MLSACLACACAGAPASSPSGLQEQAPPPKEPTEPSDERLQDAAPAAPAEAVEAKEAEQAVEPVEHAVSPLPGSEIDALMGQQPPVGGTGIEVDILDIRQVGPSFKSGPKARLQHKRSVLRSGVIDVADLDKVVHRRAGAFLGCYSRNIGDDDPREGVVRSEITIDAEGKVAAVELLENGFNEKFGDCVVEFLRRLRFPPPDESPVVFEKPFRLRPKK
jgi:hypothetical protein